MGRRFPDCRRSRFFHRVVVAVGEYVATWHTALAGNGVAVCIDETGEYSLFLSIILPDFRNRKKKKIPGGFARDLPIFLFALYPVNYPGSVIL